MNIRSLNIDDGELLRSWRNDKISLSMSTNADFVDKESHVKWLIKKLNDPLCEMYVAEISGTPVGVVRTEFDRERSRLSWTVSPHHRGKGYGKKMVLSVVSDAGGAFCAFIREDNLASMKIAEAAGFFCLKKENGFLVYVNK